MIFILTREDRLHYIDQDIVSKGRLIAHTQFAPHEIMNTT